MIELQVIGASQPALVDDDFFILQRYRWRLHKKGFVFRHGDRVIKLHRVVLGSIPPGLVVHYANGSRLDCRRKNLGLVAVADKNKLGRRKRKPSGGVFQLPLDLQTSAPLAIPVSGDQP